MSTRRTVEVWVSCSVRWTSKSVGARRIRRSPVAARAAGAFSSRPRALNSVPRRSRWNGSPNSYGLVASSRSPPRPPRSIRWPPNASRWSRANRSSRTFWPIRRVPARGELEPLPVAGEVAGLLEPAGEVVERVEVAHRVVAEQVADLVAIDRGRGRRPTRRRTARRPAGPSHRAGRSGRARPRGRAARRPRTGPGRRARRAGAGPGSRPAGRGRPAAGRRAGAPPSSTGARRAAAGSSSAGATASRPSAGPAGR